MSNAHATAKSSAQAGGSAPRPGRAGRCPMGPLGRVTECTWSLLRQGVAVHAPHAPDRPRNARPAGGLRHRGRAVPRARCERPLPAATLFDIREAWTGLERQDPADLDTGTLHEACLGQCNQFFAQHVESANTCERVVAAMNEFYPLLGVYCGADGHCPAPPPPHFGGEPPAELPPVCVAFTDRMTQCITEACPALEVYQDPFARDLWYSCSSALTGQIPFPYVDAVEAEAFERLALQGCDAPDLKFLVDRRIQADRQLHSPQLLAHFCAEGPLVPEEECRAACDLWTQCNPDWDMLACMYWCSAEAANTATIMCATTAVDCDTLTGCFAPISKADPGVLANYPGGECYQSEILPAPGEEGMLVATRLTPPNYPWRVETVQYTAAAFQAIDYTCSTAFDARVEVSVIDGETPPAAPELLAVIPVEGLELPPDTMRFVDLPLPEPIVLREGQHLLVATARAGRSPRSPAWSAAARGSPSPTGSSGATPPRAPAPGPRSTRSTSRTST